MCGIWKAVAGMPRQVMCSVRTAAATGWMNAGKIAETHPLLHTNDRGWNDLYKRPEPNAEGQFKPFWRNSLSLSLSYAGRLLAEGLAEGYNIQARP